MRLEEALREALEEREKEIAQFVNRWIPTRVCILSDVIIKYKTKTGLLVSYPPKTYSIPPRLHFIAHPEVYEILEETEIPTSPAYPGNMGKRTLGLLEVTRSSNGKVWSKAYKARIRPGVYIVKIDTKRGNIHILIPRRPVKRVVANIYVLGIYGKSTGMGGGAGGSPWNGIELYSSNNSSASGRHWITWAILATKPDEPLKMHLWRVSNRGNSTEWVKIITPECEEKEMERYEVLESIESKGLNCGWARVEKVKDNLDDSVETRLVLEYHEAIKTPARTYHEIEPEDAVEAIESTRHPSKTHWIEIYRIKKPLKLRTMRISNSGKREECEATIEP